ncbi:MAG TPA: ABC transporter permease [Terriglobales bacterium]|nr:ABC transporter permease [Terriglobales bacterium]
MLQDFRYAARQLGRSPGFAVIVVLTLALGIGANAAIFSIVNWLLLRPLPVRNPGQLTTIWQQQGNQEILFPGSSVPDYRELASQSTAAFDDVFGYELDLVGLRVRDNKAERVVTNYVTGNFFSALGLKPALGRLILPSEGSAPGSDPVIVLSYSFWKRRLGGDPGILGTRVLVNGHPLTVVGVAPEGFQGISPFLAVSGYVPLGMGTVIDQPPDFMSNRGQRGLNVLARLRRGVSVQQAQAAIGVVAQRLAQQYPDVDKNLMMMVFPETRSRLGDPRTDSVNVICGLFLGLAGLVLLLACVNVANILLVRASTRAREMAIRAALGARRARLVRQLLIESVLVAALGGAAGLLVGWLGTTALTSINLQTDLPVLLALNFDWRVFAYAFIVALLTGVIVGVFPALRASRRDLASALHEGGRGVIGTRQRIRTALVVAQVAGSLMLLIMAGLFTRSLGHVQQTKLGFEPAQVVDLTMDPAEVGYHSEQTREFYRELLARIRATPGVVSATSASSVPFGYYGSADSPLVEGYQPPRGQGAPVTLLNYISTDYFGTLRIPLLRGRAFTDADSETAPYVAIVNETFAKRFWPNQDAVGREFKLAGDVKHPLKIVGVARDARYQFFAIAGAGQPYVYLPFSQHVDIASLQTVQVRTSGNPGTMIPMLEQAVSALAPNLPVFEMKTLTQALYSLNGFLIFEVGAALAAVLGGLGLVLSVVGVYGVISYAASQRTHEIGVRMALGAQPGEILRMIFRQGIFIVGLGLLAGVAGALAAAQVAGTFLTVSATDPLTYVTVSIVLALVALIACAIPARRAMRVDPMVALRYE